MAFFLWSSPTRLLRRKRRRDASASAPSSSCRRGCGNSNIRLLPSLLLCIVALWSILPIILAANKESTTNPRRWASVFLRGGGGAISIVDNDDSSNTNKKASSEYRTVQVQLVHRHGDRTPITPFKDEVYWASTLVPPEMLQKVAQGTNVLHNHHDDETTTTTTTAGGESGHVAQGRGPFGKLTQMGLLQMIEVGTRVKGELEAMAWSPQANVAAAAASASDSSFQLLPHHIKIFSTDFPRTIQSVQGVLVGFFPDGPSQTLDIDCRHTTSWMIPDPQPRRSSEQEALELELAHRPHILEREAEMRPLAVRCTQSLLPLLGDDAFKVSYGVGEDKKDDKDDSSNTPHGRTLSWAQLSEMTKCLQVRNLLPDDITIEDQEATSAYCAWKWFESLRNPRLAFLAMHHFTNTIVQGMKDFEKEPPVIIFSGHDSSLIGLLCAFHLEQPSVWPEYGSVLKMELLEKISGKEGEDDDLVVRFYLNGELLRSMWHGRSREEISLKKLAHYTSTVGAVKAS